MNIRPLEKTDLMNLHRLNNIRNVMSYWFEEPYESFDELVSLYEKHIHDDGERRFVIEENDFFVGVVELMEISYIHRNCEIQIAIHPEYEGRGLAQQALQTGIDYGFDVLNLHKIYLYVDVANEKAIHIYEKLGFQVEGRLLQQFYASGDYHDSFFMGLFKSNRVGSVSPL